MIKSKATINGVVFKQAAMRRDKNGNEFISFSVKLKIPGSRNNMAGMDVYVSTSVPAEGYEMQSFVSGVRILATGTLTFRKAGDNLYLNFYADMVEFNPQSTDDVIDGILDFRGTIGKKLEHRRDKKERSYVSFSAFSTVKIKDDFEFVWVRFVRFDYEPEPFMRPKAKIHATGKMLIAAYDGRISIDCHADSFKDVERYSSTSSVNTSI